MLPSSIHAGRDLAWVRRMGGSLEENVYQIATDKEGSVYVTGVFRSSDADFDTFHLSSQGSYDIS